jgi:hypothetical protein
MGGNQPKYGAPYVPSGDGANEPDDPDKGKDLWSDVPQVEVLEPWNGNPGPPSFNDDPPDFQQAGSAPSSAAPQTEHIAINMATVRYGEEIVLEVAKVAVAEYEALREKVYYAKDTVFGQQAVTYTNGDGTAAGGAGGGGSNVQQIRAEPSKLQASAKEFADNINPAQEKVLEQIANGLELVGQFVAGVNKAGQGYGAADRKTRFPEPPPSPVTKT